ncbi:poly-gamma-glutamate synthase PgsB [Weissella thailandensis]|uniref:Poly-gamma-glutamate synthase PgsB n=1 Tax=Weissella thailandensis TaxID=89061 RepID=A0ABX9I6W0_9LACO|nr:poly-gamma-glutamate synthase PgsB [Weissella thailandensis]NKY90299.1 poly-gamma-glutamate synthase PgsB [Weissella thailandensis]RDS60469.1 poly-gamma-glutamate synthase PgsB [Weissella thailandensis]GEP74947.1 PGA synthase CapB [Weissella thailandensis]
MNFELALLIIIAVVLVAVGIIEKKHNHIRATNIPIRVNVNGIRGKSTATRLITAIIDEAGYKTMGKTTGTAARKIFPYKREEIPIQRKPQGANIKEQLDTIKEAERYKVDALVCECMAVKPEYQEIYQHQMFKSNIYVIVNVLEDHLDQMGPTLTEIGYTFAKSIPYNGYVVTVPSPFTTYFQKVADERNTKLVLADNSRIPSGYLDKFDYVLFKDNVSLAMAVADILNIDEEVAFRGMLNAEPDPGALKVKRIQNDKVDFTFVNAFAANEPASTLNIWEYIKNNPDIPSDNPIVLFNGRPDRGDRTEQFAKDFFPYVENATIIGMGQAIRRIGYYYDKGFYPDAKEYIDEEDEKPVSIMKELLPLLNGRVLLTVGNIHGDAEELLDIIKDIM